MLFSDTCCLNFFSECHDLEDSFECVNVSEDDVARRQVEEDLQLYGSRPQPSDAIDISDNCTEQTKAQPKRNLSEVEPADDRPAKISKSEEPGRDSVQCVTAMDWNSGASPLDAWLNQSAVPSQSTTNQEPSGPSEKDFIAQEAEEIKAFRTAHVAMTTEVASMSAKHAVDKDFASLTLGAQVYYRNIKDRYPNIPSFLARRLAGANLDRAERLQCKRRRRTEASEKHDSFILKKGKYMDSITCRSFSQLKPRSAQDHSPAVPAKPYSDGPRRHISSSLPESAQKQRLEKNKEIRAERRFELERRCQSLQPPIESSILEQMFWFQVAIRIPLPLSEGAWQVLKPNLLAERSDAETKERQRLIESAPSREGAVDHSPVLPERHFCRECEVGQ